MNRQGTPAEDNDVDVPETELPERWFAHFEASQVTASVLGELGGMEVRDREFDEQIVSVAFDTDGVSVTVNGRDETVDAGAMGVLDPDEAREVAAAIYRAAEEVEARYGP